VLDDFDNGDRLLPPTAPHEHFQQTKADGVKGIDPEKEAEAEL
jgi:hypothetical protein